MGKMLTPLGKAGISGALPLSPTRDQYQINCHAGAYVLGTEGRVSGFCRFQLGCLGLTCLHLETSHVPGIGERGNTEAARLQRDA